MAYNRKKICYFVSPHGFGHAARAAAVISKIQERDDEIDVQVVTTVPCKLFEQSVVRPVSYFEYSSDIGFVQDTPFRENLPATLRLLDSILPFSDETVRGLSKRLSLGNRSLIICDIAPLGIAVAREAGVPSLLIENFTWDWIYAEHAADVPEINRHIEYLKSLFEVATFRIRAEPVCGAALGDLKVGPVFRHARLSPHQVRSLLGVPETVNLVLVTMGGSQAEWSPRGDLRDLRDVIFMVPTPDTSLRIVGNVVKVPTLADFHHPDLINAADAVIAKLGYSTVAEVYGSGVPLGYITRPRFRESAVLERYIRERVPTTEIGVESFERHMWAPQLNELLELVRAHPATEDGASQVAEYVTESILRS